jgi:catechol 2,3-dioxygenase-like lactoylglutathione lyase family enzyme
LIEVERTDFVSVPVRDVERAVEFYEGTLGIRRNPKSGGFPEFETGNVSLYLIDPTKIDSGATFTPHSSYIALRVPDVAAARTKLEGAGVAFEGETLDTGVCHMAFFRDPDGNALMLHRRYASDD